MHYDILILIHKVRLIRQDLESTMKIESMRSFFVLRRILFIPLR